MVEHEWKGELVDRLVQSWSLHRTGTPIELGESLEGFGEVEDIPDRMSRSEAWLLEYSREPYLQRLSIRELRVQFHRIMAVNSLTFVKGSWPKPSNEVVEQGLRLFQHVVAETNRRGVDMREMDISLTTEQERTIIYRNLPQELVSILNPSQ